MVVARQNSVKSRVRSASDNIYIIERRVAKAYVYRDRIAYPVNGFATSESADAIEASMVKYGIISLTSMWGNWSLSYLQIAGAQSIATSRLV